MRNFKKTFVSLVLSGACALSLTASACSNGSTTGGDPADTEHEHTYSDEWVYNSTQHWHPASCDDTNTVSDQANHVDENGDLVCDVCGWNYPHEHTFDNDWAANAEGHYHPSTCGHDVTSEVEAHTPDIMGVCTVCGYQVSEPDVSTVEKALEIADYQSSLIKHSEGSYDRTSYGRDSSYQIITDYYDDYTRIEYTGSYVDQILWHTLVGENDVFSVVSENGEDPTLYNYEVSPENLGGYGYQNPFALSETYYGVTNLAIGIYEYASYYDMITDEGVDEGVYSYSIEAYVEGYSTDPQTGEDTVRNRNQDHLYLVEVSFTLSNSGYIATLNYSYSDYDYDSLVFQTEDESEHGTIAENAEPIEIETHSYAQYDIYSPNPYDPDEVLMTAFDVADADENIISGDEDAPAVLLAPGQYYSYNLANVEPSTAVPSLNSITATLYQYNSELDEYEQVNTGFSTVNIYTTSGISISPSYSVAVGTIFRIVLTSSHASTIINVEIGYPAPTSIAATANGSDTDVYNTYTGVDVTISGSVTYGYDPGFTAAITSDNAADATLINNVFSTNVTGTYEVTVTSTKDETVSDTITLVVAEPPAAEGLLNGTYYASPDYNSQLGWTSDGAFINFAPESEGALNGTLSYILPISTGNTTVSVSGTATYSYNEETLTFTISGVSLAETVAGEVAYDDIQDSYTGLGSLELSFSNQFTPVVSGNVLYMRNSSYDPDTGTQYYSQRSFAFSIEVFEFTEEPFPGSGEEPGGDPDEPDEPASTEELLTTTTWTGSTEDSAGDPYDHTLIFNSDGTGYVVCGTTLEGSTASIFFTWTVDGYDVTVEYDESQDRNAYDIPAIDETRSTFMTITDNGGGNYTVSWCGVDFNGTSTSGGDTTPAFVGNEYYCEAYGEWGASIWFDEAGWFAIYEGTLPELDGYASAIVYMSWELDTNGDITTDTTLYGNTSDPSGYFNGFEAGMIATYDADNDTITFGGYTFEVFSW